jgi:hypothetical protein
MNVPLMANALDALAHRVALIIVGCKTLLAIHNNILLIASPHTVVKTKRSNSLWVVRCLDRKVQYLFQKKLFAAPLAYASEL